MNLDELLRQSEGKTLEFKADLGIAEPLLRSVVAFANTAGGTVLLGVQDKTRKVIGVRDPLAIEERLANLVSDAIRPRLAPEITVVPWRKTHLIAVRVYPSPNRPHYLKSLGSEEGVFLRVGSTDRKADGVLLAELRRYAGDRTFDEQPLLDLDSEALDFRAASESFAPIRRLAPRDLEVLGLADKHQEVLRPTAGGILLFGKDRVRLYPDAYLQAGRFAGRDRSRILDSLEIRDHLPGLVDAGLSCVRKHENVAVAISGARHEERWIIPLVAMREALVNAARRLYPIVRDYVSRRCFGKPVDVETDLIRSHLRRTDIQDSIAKHLAREISVKTVELLATLEFENASFRLSDTKPFQWSRNLKDGPLTCERTVFNYVATFNPLERRFALFLDRAPDVVRFASLGTMEQEASGTRFRVDYLKPSGAIGFYYPDWVVVQKADAGETNWILETKGRVWEGTEAKDRAIGDWCDRLSGRTGTVWRFARINQPIFDGSKWSSLATLLIAATR